ncbi:hypothetical protein CBR_g20135 [Chara braunii]|uniref:Uncharacterized protein n=1 Tax=Chara braunii TaxID=69332 RepID=A0A388KZL4_CHABU|nr:hypothetical protein CBR_g20135 [Chara braunii]|eukprot:GBG75504.1 hypothetical protein CBR_g20135 [Chara braunii]
MLESAHVAAHLLCPSRRNLRYYEGVVSDYDASLVREAEVYILSQTGFSLASPEYETACAQMRDFHTRRGGIAWGGRDGDREAQRCTGDVETYEAGCWWSKWGQCAPQLQVIPLRVMYIWTCSSPAKKNRVVHEGVQTKKCNRLEFEKVAKLVEISANVRLLSHQGAGRGFALSWTVDGSLLDVEGGIGTRPSWKGTEDSRTQEELECQRRSWQRDPCGSRAPPGEVADVFGTRAATLRPYPRDDESDYKGREQEDERAGPTTATPAAQEVDEWSDPEDVRGRSGGDDFFGGVNLQGEEELWGCYGSPVEQQRPTSPGMRSVERERVHGSAPSRGAELGCGGGAPGQPPDGRLRRSVKGPRQRLEEIQERLAGGEGGVGVAAVVDGDAIGTVRDEGMPGGGGGDFSEFGNLGMPPGESESRGDISVGMQAVLREISVLHPETFSPAMCGELMQSSPEAEGDEDSTPSGETSEERLDRLDSRRACLMARGDPLTQELARLAVEERQRQLGTFTRASLDVETVVHMDPSTGARDGTQGEAALVEASRTGGDVEQSSHVVTAIHTHVLPNQPPHDERRSEDTLHEAAGMPLPTGLVEGVVHMSPGLEDEQTGQSVGVDDVRPSAQAEGIGPTTRGRRTSRGTLMSGGQRRQFRLIRCTHLGGKIVHRSIARLYPERT